MSKDGSNKVNEQLERLFVGPARAYTGLSIDHFEKLAEVQLEATKAYADLGLQQVRAALEIKAPQDLQSYVTGQQVIAKTLSERVQGDAEKVVALNREFAEKAQKLVQENAASFSRSAQ